MSPEAGGPQNEALIINRITLRGPEMEVLYKHLVSEQRVSREEVLKRFVPPGGSDSEGKADLVSSALDVLQILGLVSRTEGPTPELEAKGGKGSFPKLFLQALRSQPKRQSAFIDLYDWCVRKGILTISEEELLNEARRHVNIDAGWTAEKIKFWASLANYVGIATPWLREGRGVLIAPTAKRLIVCLRGVMALDRSNWAQECFEQIDRKHAPCFADGGELHPGWTQTLEWLRAKGKVELPVGSDAPDELRVAGGRHYGRILLAGTAGTGEVVNE